jgi:hypothetical protein
MRSALGYLDLLHDAGIAHGDISPDNIFLETEAKVPEDGILPHEVTIRLVDFNSARRIEGPENRPSELFLKPNYAAPELVRGGKLSVQSDLYALGIVFYELLSGHRPYQVTRGSDFGSLTEDSIPPLPLALEVPQLFEDLLRSLLAMDPSLRPPSASACLRRMRELDDIHLWLSRTTRPEVVAIPESAGGAGRTAEPASPSTMERLANATTEPLEGRFATVTTEIPGKRSAAAEPPGERSAAATTELLGEDQQEEREREVSLIFDVPVPGRSNEVERVDFSVFAPATVAPGRSFVLEIWAYLREKREEVLERAMRQGSLLERGSRGPVQVPLAKELTLLVWLDGFVVRDEQDSFFWFGETTNVPFVVECPEDLQPGDYPGQISILHCGMLLSRLVFSVSVGTPVDKPKKLGVKREHIQSAFASYATVDRDEVLRRVQGLTAAGMDVFLDVLALRAGDQWEERVLEGIRTTDVFYLFWSKAARESTWVEKEWRYALEEKGLDYIHPIPLVAPEEAPPPSELAGRHFNDLILACMKSQAAALGKTPA